MGKGRIGGVNRTSKFMRQYGAHYGITSRNVTRPKKITNYFKKKKGRRGSTTSTGSTRSVSSLMSDRLTKKMIDEGGSHNRLTSSKIVVRVPGKQAKSPKGVFCTIKHVWDGVFRNGTGTQGVHSMGSMCQKGHLIDTPVIAGTVPISRLPVNLFDINPQQGLIGNMQATGTYTAAPKFDRVYLDSIRGTLNLVNLSAVATHVKLYCVVARTSNASSPSDYWASELTDLAADQGKFGALSNATYTYNGTGVLTVTAGNPGTMNGSIVGTVPTMLPSWRKAFKVLKVKKLVLEPGEANEVNYHVVYKKYFDREFIKDLSTATVPNRTLHWFMIVHGALVHLTDTASAGQVTHGPTQVGYLFNQAYKVKPVISKNKVPYIIGAGNEISQTYANATGTGTNQGGAFTKMMDVVDDALNVANAFA